MRKSRQSSFDLLNSYKHWLPGIRGMFMLLLMYFLGAALSNVVVFCLTLALGQEFVQLYGLMIAYPFQFLPAMFYVARMSAHNELAVEAVKLDDSHFSVGGAIWATVACIVATLCMAVICEPVVYILPEMPDWLKQILSNMTGGPLWVSLLSVAVLAPFFEEWLCRGVLLRGLLSRMKPVWAIVISSAFFAFIHLNPWQAIPAFLIGCLFGYVYYKTRSLKLTMLMHCVNNATSVLIMKLPCLEGKEYLWEAFDSKWQYGLTFALCIALLMMFVAVCGKLAIAASERDV